MKKSKNKGEYRSRVADNIYAENRNGNISYRVVYKGKRKRFKNLEDAKKYTATLTLDDPKVDSSIKGQETFKYYAEKLLKFLKNEKKITTYETKRAIMENIIYPNFEDKSINEITKDDCKSFRDYISEQEYATNYKNAIIVVFKQVFNYAYENYGVNKECVSGVKRFGKSEKDKEKEDEKVEDIWEPEEFKKFISCINSKFYKTLFTVSITSWARIGEVQALKWKAYDGHSITIRRNIIKVRKNINPKCFEEVSVKTNKSKRVIVLPEATCKMLNEMKEKQEKIPGFDKNWYIFNRWDGKKYKDGTYPVSKTCIDRAFQKGISQSKVKKIRIHDLRGSGASYAIMSGADIKAVSERLGHEKITTTLESYHHVISKIKSKLMTNTNDYVDFDEKNNED